MTLLRFNGKLLKYNNKLLKKTSGDAPVGHGWFIPSQDDVFSGGFVMLIWQHYPDVMSISEFWLSNFKDVNDFWTYSLEYDSLEWKPYGNSISTVLFRYIPKTGESPGHTTPYNSVIVDTSGAEYDLELYRDIVSLPMVNPDGFTGTLGGDGLENTLALYAHDPSPGTAVHYAVNFNPQ